MTLRRIFIAGLLGCTMLAGCNDTDNKADKADGSGTYQELKDDYLKLKGTNENLGTTLANTEKTLGELQLRLAALEPRVAGTETDVKTLNLKDRIKELQAALAGMQGRMKTVEIEIADLQALADSLNRLGITIDTLDKAKLATGELTTFKGLKDSFTALKMEVTELLDKRLKLASLNDLKDRIADLEKGNPDIAGLDDLKEVIKEKQASLDEVEKRGATTTEDFKKRIAALEDAVTLFQPREDIAGLTKFVNPFIGTSDSETGGGHSGNNHPGAQMPFGMVSFGPDTNSNGGDYGAGASGYDYRKSSIDFFSMTHLNGPGCFSQGVVALLPRIGLDTKTQGFKHADEQASPGYYKVTTTDKITIEMTATVRTGMARFTYPADGEATLIIDPRRTNKDRTRMNADLADATLDLEQRTVTGKTSVGVFCKVDGTWRSPIYFYAQFDQKLNPVSEVKDGAVNLTFDLAGAPNRSVQLKVGISSVSVKNAQLNLEAENSAWAFEGPDGIRTKAEKEWNSRLNTIQLDVAKPDLLGALEADKQAKAKQYLAQFYSALYRSMGGPTVYSDFNGDYRTMKQENPGNTPRDTEPVRGKVNVADYKFKLDGKDAGYKTHYSGFSTWDTYRSVTQLQALLFPDEVSEMMQSLVVDAQQCGAFPHWVNGSEDTTPMEGDHTPNVIAGAYAFGARKFDLEKTKKYLWQAQSDPKSACNDKPSIDRELNGPLADFYFTNGYIPSGLYRPTGGKYNLHAGSFSLEMITTAQSIGAFVAALPASFADTNTQTQIATLRTRAGSWTKLFRDTTLGSLDAKGTWSGSRGEFHETTSENYLWSFAHDWSALIARLGGKTEAVKTLDKLLSIPALASFNDKAKEPTGANLNGGENATKLYIGNEPAFQTPWAYNWAGSPRHAQYIIPIILTKNFSLNPGGLPGNDDLGAMSAWYVWAALGLYPVIPSVPGMAVSTPQFSGATVWLGNGKKLRLETDKQALLDNVRYINEMKLNGTTYPGSWLPLDKIKNGGTLKYTLSATPTEWGAGDDLTPPSGPDADYSKPTAKPLPAVQLIQ